MAIEKATQKRGKEFFLRVWPKGQMTIPRKVRRLFGIEDGGFISMVIKGDTIMLTPVKVEKGKQPYFREYSKEEVQEFLKEDKLDKETLAKARKLLRG